MSKVKNTKEQNWGLTEERRRKNKRQYRLHIMIQNQTWYIVHWTNLVHGFFSKVQVHLGQSFVFFVFQSSELFTFFFFTVPNHFSGTVHNQIPVLLSIVLVDVVVVSAVIHVVVLEVVVDVVACSLDPWLLARRRFRSPCSRSMLSDLSLGHRLARL